MTKTYDHQIWHAGVSRGVDSNKTNQSGAGDVITSRSGDKLQTYTTTNGVPVTTKFGRMITYLDRLLKSNHPLTTRLTISRDKLKSIYLHYNDAHRHQTWHGCDLPCVGPTHKITWPSLVWFFTIRCQTKAIISPLPQCPWPQNLAWCLLTLSRFYPYCHITIKSRDLAISSEKLKQ